MTDDDEDSNFLTKFWLNKSGVRRLGEEAGRRSSWSESVLEHKENPIFSHLSRTAPGGDALAVFRTRFLS